MTRAGPSDAPPFTTRVPWELARTGPLSYPRVNALSRKLDARNLQIVPMRLVASPIKYGALPTALALTIGNPMFTHTLQALRISSLQRSASVRGDLSNIIADWSCKLHRPGPILPLVGSLFGFGILEVIYPAIPHKSLWGEPWPREPFLRLQSAFWRQVMRSQKTASHGRRGLHSLPSRYSARSFRWPRVIARSHLVV
jgi:hypothetical protein